MAEQQQAAPSVPSWEEVKALPEMNSLSNDELDQARQAYFSDVVAPQIPEDQHEAAWAAFEVDTQPSTASKVLRSTGQVLDSVSEGVQGVAAQATAGIRSVLPKDPTLDDLFLKYGTDQGVDPELLRGIADAETGHIKDMAKRLKAVSPKGAMGLMQFMRPTANRFGVLDPNDPEQAVRGAAQYQRVLLDRYDGDKEKSAAAYNAGEGAVDRAIAKANKAGNPNSWLSFLPTETQNYVPKVLGPRSSRMNPQMFGLPIKQEGIDAVKAQYDAADPATRAKMVTDTGWAGRIARTLDEEYKRADSVLRHDPTLTAMGDRLEDRMLNYQLQGVDPKVATQQALDDIVMGQPSHTLPTIGSTDFDFERAAQLRGASPIVRGLSQGTTLLQQQAAGLNKLAADLGEELGVPGAEQYGQAQLDARKKLSLREMEMGENPNDFNRNLESAISSTVSNAPSYIAALFTGGQTLPLIGMATQVVGDEYARSLEAGKTKPEAIARAVPYGAAEFLGEKFGFKDQVDLIRRAAGGNAAEFERLFVKTMAEQVAGEEFTTTAQFAIDKNKQVGLNPEATAADYFTQVKDTLFQTILQTAIMGAPGGAQAIKARLRESDEAQMRAGRDQPETTTIPIGFTDAEQNQNPAQTDLGTGVVNGQPPAAHLTDSTESAGGVLAGQREPEVSASGGETQPTGEVQGEPVAAATAIESEPETPEPATEALGDPQQAAFEQAPSDYPTLQARMDAAKKQGNKTEMARLRPLLKEAKNNLQTPTPAGSEQPATTTQPTQETPYVQSQNPAPQEALQEPEQAVKPAREIQIPPVASLVDSAAHEAAPSPLNDHSGPTPAQKEAGNYKKGHAMIGGLDISIENPQSSERKGVDRSGKPWSINMQHHYGYIKGTRGRDKDHVDVFVKPSTPEDYSGKVFVIDQEDPATGRFDEHKALIGFGNAQEAWDAYHANYAADWRGAGNLTEMDMDKFKSWVKNPERTRRRSGRSGARDALYQRFGGKAANAAPILKDKPAVHADRTVDPKADSLLTAIAKSGGIDVAEAKRQGIDPAYFGKRGHKIFRVFTKTGMTLDDMAHSVLSPAGYPVTGANDLLDALDRELRGNKVHTPAGDEKAAERLAQDREDTAQQIPTTIEESDPFDPFKADTASPGFELDEDEYHPDMDAHGRRLLELSHQLDTLEEGLGEDIIERAAIQEWSNEHTLQELEAAIASQTRATAAQGEQSQGARPETQGQEVFQGKSGLTAYVTPNADGKRFNVSAQDPDSGEALPEVKIFATREAAVKRAKKIAGVEGEAGGFLQPPPPPKPATTQPSSTGAQGDVFGPRDENAQALADKQREKDKQRNGTQDVPAGMGAGDVFSGKVRQGDMADAQPANKKEFTFKPGTAVDVDGRTIGRSRVIESRWKPLGFSEPSEVVTIENEAGNRLDVLASELIPVESPAQASAAASPKPELLGKESAEPAKPEASKEWGANNTLVSKDRAAELRDRLKKKLGQLNAGIDPEMLAIGAELAAFHIEAGARRFADFARTMAQDLDTPLESLRPYLRSWYNGARDMIEDHGLNIEGTDDAETVKAEIKKLFDTRQADSPATNQRELPQDAVLRVVPNKSPGMGEWPFRAYLSSNSPGRGGYLSVESGGETEQDATNGAKITFFQKLDGRKPAPHGSIPSTREAESSLLATPEAVAPESANPKAPTQAIADDLTNGRKFANIVDARKRLSELTGQKYEPGTAEAKRADEMIELAGVMAARQIVERGQSERDAPELIFDELADLADLMPALNVRTSTSVAQQAYSTPLPLAYVASRRAGIVEGGTVLEPTAGNGALLIEASPAKVQANELNSDRAEALRSQGFKVSERDASEAGFKPVQTVIANPPFGIVKDDSGESRVWQITPQYQTTEIDHVISLNALRAMRDDGRAVLIIGGPAKTLSEAGRSDAYNGRAKRSFFYTLYNEYNVTDHFTVSGDLYAKQGAAWPVDVIVIEGRGKSKLRLPAADLPRIVNSIEELKNELHPRRPTEAVDGNLPASRETTEAGPGTPADNAESGEAPVSSGDGQRPENGKGKRVRTRSGNGAESTRSERGPVADESVGELRDERGTGAGSDSGQPGVTPPAKKAESKKPEANTYQTPYAPASAARSVGTLVPTNMRDAVRGALAKLSDTHGDVDAYVAESLGYDKTDIPNYFSAEQVDALALALDNMAKGKGFIIGDQTGVGKGRVVAGVIRYAIKNGKVPIFVTEKPNLYGDMLRDLADIGLPDLKPIVTNAGFDIPMDDDAMRWYEEAEQAKADGERVPARYGNFLKTPAGGTHAAQLAKMMHSGKLEGHDVIFTTYNQMQTVKGERTTRMDFLERFATGGVVIFDESHNAGGQEAGRTNKKKGEEAGEKIGRAAFSRAIARVADSVFYSSATYAKRPEVMDLYFKTDMGMAVGNASALTQALLSGGVPLQQVVASMLAKAGQYIRREKSFDGIDYLTVPAEVDKRFAENASTIMRDIMKFDKLKTAAIAAKDKELKSEARKMSGDNSTGGSGAMSTNFTSVMHNLIGQMLLTLKVQPTLQEALKALERGEKPVIALANTMGSAIQEYVEETGLNPGDAIALTFGDLLKRYLEKSRRIIEGDAFGKKTSRQLTDEELGPTAMKFYRSIQKKIDAMNFGDVPISPIDAIRQGLAEKGYTVGEITGRTATIDYSGNLPVYRRRSADQTSTAGKRKTISDFNSGKLDAIILNQSGATGLSLHASEKFKDQQKRYMIIAQPELNIDTHMQMLGRVNRTGQVRVPSYAQLVADIPAEKRPASILAKKMAMLNANTTANRDSAMKAKDTPDFMNEYGDEVAAQVMTDNPNWHQALGSPLKYAMQGDGLDKEDAMRKVTGRIPVLSLKDQEAVYAAMEEAYIDLLDTMTRTGQNALEAQTQDLDAKTVNSVEVQPRVSASDSPFAEGVNAEVMDVKRIGKPYTFEQVKDLIAKNAGAKAGENVTDILRRRQAEQIQQVHEAVAKLRKDIEDDYTDKVDAKKEGAELMRLEDQARRVFDLLDHRPGHAATLVSPQGIEYIGYVGKIERKGTAENPVAPGTWKITVYVADPARQFTLPLSKIGEGEGRWGLVKGASGDLQKTFEEGQNLSREQRTILTGNLLAGFGAFNSGQIINFTAHDGRLMQGILMPRKFDLEKENQARPVPFQKVGQATTFLRSMQGSRMLKSESGDVRITSTDGRRYYIFTPAAKGKGARYFLNKNLLAAVGGDFVKANDAMRAVFYDSDLDQVLEVLHGMGEQMFAGTHQEEAKKLIGQAAPKFSRAWHSSPHDFDEFGLHNIGGGEGRQAFGWGLYFAGNKNIANWYNKRLGYKAFIEKVMDLYGEYDSPNEADAALFGSDDLSEKEKNLLNALQDEEWLGFSYPHQAVHAAIFEPKSFDIDPGGPIQKAIDSLTHLYEVELAPQESDYLDWDKPLSEQSEKVKSLIHGKNDQKTGKDLYQSFTKVKGGPEQASRALARYGIPGIRYKDGTARGTSKESYNYVIFDDRLVQVVGKYSRDRPSQPTEAGSTLRKGIEELHDAIGADFHRMVRMGLVRIVQSPTSLPAAIRNSYHSESLGFVRGVWDGKTSYLVADNIAAGDWTGVFLHESGIHGSLADMLGGEFRALADDFLELVKAGDKTAKAIQNHIVKLVRGNEMDPDHADEERIAYAVEFAANQKPGTFTGRFRLWLTRVMAALRAWFYRSPLYKKLEAKGFRMKLSAQDMAALARQAVRARTAGAAVESGLHLKYSSPMNKTTVPMKHPWQMTLKEFYPKDWPESSTSSIDERYKPAIGTINYFYRVGSLPASGRSRNYRDGTIEEGVSVYAFPEVDSFAGFKEADWWIGKGKVVGFGSDGEPLIEPQGKWHRLKGTSKLARAYEEAHEYFVRAAVAQGKNVPPHVLIDYPDIRFSRSLHQAIRDEIAFTFVRDKKFGPLKNLMTQFHKAWKNPEFKSVFDRGQDFLTDTTKYAMQAESLAPDMLVRLESLKDVFKTGAGQKDTEAVAKALFAGTLDGGANPEDGVVWSDADLSANFGLNARQIGYYHQSRKAIDASLDTAAITHLVRLGRQDKVTLDPDMSLEDVAEVYLQELQDRIDAAKVDLQQKEADFAVLKPQRTAKAIQAKKDLKADISDVKATIATLKASLDRVNETERRANSLKEHGYFPLMRFGEHRVTITSTDAKGEQNVEFVGHYETQREALRNERNLLEDFEHQGLNVQAERRVMPQLGHELYRGINPETVSLFAEQTGLDQDPLLQEYLKTAISGRSAMKRLIHRKGMPGFNTDIKRALAAFITSNARLASANLHMGPMLNAIEKIKAGDVKDDAIELYRYLTEPKEEAAAFRSFLFFWFIGASPASALVNATQPVMMTYPYLAQHGVKDAAKYLLGATQEAATGTPKADVKRAYDRAMEEGVVAPHEIYQLMATARGAVGSAQVRTRFMKVWGSFFAMAEAWNRRLTFLASYRAAQDNGLGDPYEFAKNAVYETQGIYNRGNRPNWARGRIGATVFTFKQFSISYLEFLRRLPGKERAIALGFLILAAGLEGLPFADDLDDIIDTVGQWSGYATNSKKWKRQHVEKVLAYLADAAGDTDPEATGEVGAEALLHGVSAALPIDISSRFGFGNLIPGTAAFKPSETNKIKEATEVFGPAGGLVDSGTQALEKATKGDLTGAIRTINPKPVRDVISGYQAATSGEFKDRRGRKVVGDVSMAEAISKGIGFNPKRLASGNRKLGEEYDDVAIQKNREDAIVTKWVNAYVEDDEAGKDKAMAELETWNDEHPEMPIRITPQQLKARIKAIRMTKEERFRKATPPEMRR
jgi:hypothetical protein